MLSLTNAQNAILSIRCGYYSWLETKHVTGRQKKKLGEKGAIKQELGETDEETYEKKRLKLSAWRLWEREAAIDCKQRQGGDRGEGKNIADTETVRASKVDTVDTDAGKGTKTATDATQLHST